MDLAAISLILSTVLSLAAIAVAVYGLEERRRGDLIRAGKRWAWWLLLMCLGVNSLYGFVAFGASAAPIRRSDVLVLLVHVFNTAALLFFLIVMQLVKALEARRTAKRSKQASEAH